ncbi:MAG TPA: MBOAT family O-acyltransferase [Rhizomicrobium sp.]
MIFTTLSFALFFFVVYVLLLGVRNDAARRYILLAASLYFYAFWNAWYLLLMAAVTLWSFGLGLFIAAAKDERRKRFGVAAGVTLSLLALAVFKYAGFFSQNVVLLTGGTVPSFIRDIVLPIGISFYTFHSISYYVDVYRGLVRPARSLRDYALYISFFPQLVAGPIVRASQFLPQLARPVTLTAAGFAAGARLFLAGAVQKLVIADQVSPFADGVFASPALYSGTTEWLGVLAYAMQIFGDFSGYTMMAIGIALILGYQLPQNFRMPYVAVSLADFWRRWHITLSFFLRDYLYIPLGGNRRGFARAQFNTMITMLLGGLWHGASWNFVLWGALHGGGIVAYHAWERFTGGRGDERRFAVPGPAAWGLTLLFVVMAWIPFRAARFADTQTIVANIWTLAPGVRWLHVPTLFVLAGVVLWHAAHLCRLRPRLERLVSSRWLYTLEIIAMLTLLLLFAPTATSPFIYFQF